MTITADILRSHGWKDRDGNMYRPGNPRMGWWPSGRLVVGWFDYPEEVTDIELLNDILNELNYETIENMDEPEILILTNDEGKRCQKCGNVYPVSHFHRCRKTPDTLQSWCIQCKKDYRVIHNMFLRMEQNDILKNHELAQMVDEVKAKPVASRRFIIRYLKSMIKQIEATL